MDDVPKHVGVCILPNEENDYFNFDSRLLETWLQLWCLLVLHSELQ